MSPPSRLPRFVPLALVAGLALGGGARAQPPVAAPATPAAPAAPVEGVLGEAPIAAGNLAGARERALNEAFRQLVEQALSGLLGESGGAPAPAVASLRASWLQRPKRLVRNYRLLEQSEQGGILRVRVTAELDEGYMRRELERARGTANRGVAPGILPVVGAGPPEAAAAVVAALNAEGVRAAPQPGSGTDEEAMRALAQRSGRGAVVLVSGRAAPEGVVRGVGQQAAECQLGVRVMSADGSAPSERSASARGFQASEAEARSACFGRAVRDLLPGLLPDLGAAAAAPGDLRVVTLDLDINEPAVISPVLRALRKLAGPASTEVRRVVVGRVEVRVSSRLGAGALLAGLQRELATLATVTGSGAGSATSDRSTAQIRLLPVAPAAAPGGPGPGPGASAQPASPAPGAAAPSGLP